MQFPHTDYYNSLWMVSLAPTTNGSATPLRCGTAVIINYLRPKYILLEILIIDQFDPFLRLFRLYRCRVDRGMGPLMVQPARSPLRLAELITRDRALMKKKAMNSRQVAILQKS